MPAPRTHVTKISRASATQASPGAPCGLAFLLAALLHADVIGSTALVRKDEALAHERIRDARRRFSTLIERYGGTTREIRGDAVVAEFPRASR
jgi:class 3 adenylate cyclase